MQIACSIFSPLTTLEMTGAVSIRMTDDELDILAAKIAGRIGVVPRWMTLKQASQYSNIGQKRLVDMIRHNHLMCGCVLAE